MSIKSSFRSGLLLAGALLLLLLPPAFAQGDENFLYTYPGSYDITVSPGDTLVLESLLVYADSNAAVGFVTNNQQPWLYLDTIPLSPLVTPESILVAITAPPSPGAYVDTITIWSEDAPNSPLAVPVNLIVESEDPDDFLVLAEPQVLNLSADVGEMAFADVLISEYYGRNVPFEVWSVSPWLTYTAYPEIPPYYTPTSLEVVAVTEGLEPGIYYDTLRIRQAIDSLPFPRIIVPVALTVTESDPSVELEVSPSAYSFTVVPGDSLPYGFLNVSEAHGDSISFSCFNYSTWLMLDTVNVVPLVTPEIVPFHVEIEGLTPGNYVDTIMVVTFEGGYQYVGVPVFLELTENGDYQIATMPTSIEFDLNLGEVGFDSLHVFEVNNSSVEFFFGSSPGWLTVEPLGLGPYYTPMTLGVTANTMQIGPGKFTGSIFIYGGAPNFDTLVVPVGMTVGALAPLVQAAPDYFVLTVEPGNNIENLSLAVYEQYGFGLPFWVELAHGSEWLEVQFPDTEDPDWLTPDSVYFDILSAGLEPGFYADTLIIFDPLDDTLTFSNVYVPVMLTVMGDEPYQVATAPAALNFNSADGVALFDSLLVFETGGRNLPFQFSSNVSWMVVEPFGMPPYYTPASLLVAVNEDTLPTGTYSGVIHITPIGDSLTFPAVDVPVTFVVGGDSLICGDADGDGITNISDAVLMINYIFNGAELDAEPCICDVNADGLVNITDIVFLINYIFQFTFVEPQCCQ